MKTREWIQIMTLLGLLNALNCYAQGALSLDIQGNNGNSQLKLLATANLAYAGPSIGIGGLGISPADSLWQGQTINNITQSLTDFATFTDITSSQSVNIDQFSITFNSFNGSTGTGFLLSFDTTLFLNTGDVIQIIPSSAMQIVPISFSNFSPGTISTPATSIFNLAFNTPFTVTVEPVPEPSIFGILAMAFTANIWIRRHVCHS